MEKQMMIRCPKCGAELPLDADAYNSIANQVKEQVVKDAVSVKEKELLDRMASQVELVKSQKDLEYKDILAKHDAEHKDALAEKDKKYDELYQKTKEYSYKVNVALSAEKRKAEKSLAVKDAEIASLKNAAAMKDKMIANEVSVAVAKEKAASQDKDVEIVSLKKELEAKDREKQMALDSKDKEMQTALAGKDQEKALALAACTKAADAKLASVNEKHATEISAYIAKEQAIKEKYEGMIALQKEELERIKDFRSKQTVKLLGESLEQHCADAYGSIRVLMPTATFGKDNTVSAESGSKGDFIFRDFQDGQELISVMFEMKNESEESSPKSKHKNEDYFKELDKDRREKKCEYAVLVTMLEPESELYNQGIVDVSTAQYPKMLVIRPQFFKPLLMMLYGLGRKTWQYKQAVIDLQKQNIDATNFENTLAVFKEGIARTKGLADKSRASAVEKIDKAIAMLQGIKADIETFDKHMTELDHKADKMTIRRLTKDAPGVLEMMQEHAAKVPAVVDAELETVEASEAEEPMDAVEPMAMKVCVGADDAGVKVDANTGNMAADAMDDSDIRDMATDRMHDTDAMAMSAEGTDLSASKTKGFEGTDCADVVSDEDEWVYVDFGEDSVAGDADEGMNPRSLAKSAEAKEQTNISVDKGLKIA